MARQTKDKSQLIKCEYCGEMYSSTYKHCPFCNEDGTGSWDEPAAEDERDDGRGGGKRLTGSGHSGRRGNATVGTVIYGIISAALIIAAAGIVISIVRPLFGSNKPKQPEPSPSATAAVVGTIPEDDDPEGLVDAQPTADPSGDVTVDPVQSMTTAAPITMTAPTSFKLNRDDFTLDHAGETFQMKATFTPADASADITWTSSDPNIASVSWNGVVTAVSQGTVKVTANVAGVGEKSCTVRCTFKSTEGSASSGQGTGTAVTTTTTTSSISLSREDFTLSRAGESWRLTVSGSSGAAVTWTSSNTSVATVGADGTVTAVGPGTCNVTATVDGQSAKCIVRCSF